ncbi:MAG: ABC transporter substrate-binding protein [Rhodospirillum sp.]|nr:ABC transporter substrate-binding protein [Rhodospirillum sp.]
MFPLVALLVLGLPSRLFGEGGSRALAQSSRAELTQPVTLTTLYWPPFTGADLPEGGTSTEIVRRSLKIAGLATAVSFLPWRRAVDMTKMGYVDAVFPVYGANDRNCVLSHPFQASILGFVERVEAPVFWKTMDDLTHRTIGVVKGYLNGKTFDGAVAQGKLTVESVLTDVMNLRKVEAGRLDLAVIDRDLLDFLLNDNPETKDLAGQLRFNARALEVKSLYACFHDSKRGNLLRQAFNEGLAVIKVQAATESKAKAN